MFAVWSAAGRVVFSFDAPLPAEETYVSAPSPSGMIVRASAKHEAGWTMIELISQQGVVAASWELDYPAGGRLVAAPIWLDDAWVLLRLRVGATTSGAIYQSVRSPKRLAVTWVETPRVQVAGVDVPTYADVTFWLWRDETWQPHPNLLQHDRPVYPAWFPDGVDFSAWQLDVPAYARMLMHAVERLEQRVEAGGFAVQLTWSGRGWMQPSPDGARAAACVNQIGCATASVLVIELLRDAPEEALLLPTSIPAEHESSDIAWLGQSRLRIDAVLPGGVAPVSQTLALSNGN